MKALKAKKKKSGNSGFSLAGFLFTVPSLIFFTIAILIPFIMGINIAFTDWNGISQDYNYVGLQNFIKIFSDTRLVAPVKNTLILALMGVVASNVLCLSLALLFARHDGKLANFSKLACYVPCCLSGVLSAFIWRFIYRFVLSELTGAESPLGKMFWVLPAVLVIILWNGSGINMLIYYAAIKGVPTDLTEAAIVDGASGWQVFRHVTVPMIAPAFTTCVTLTFTNMLKEFGTVMSATGGGPARASATISMYIYENLYTNNRAGYGQAISLAFLVFLIVVGNLMTTFFRKREVEM